MARAAACLGQLPVGATVVQDFYYNATPKAPPKREYGDAIRTHWQTPAPPLLVPQCTGKNF